MKQFNPDKNLFSVAPVGQIVIIGRNTALKGGLSRDYAINLLTWLIIASGATPEEIKASLDDAMTGAKTVLPPQRTVPKPPPPATPSQPQEVPAEVAGQVAPFIGEIDSEEGAAIVAATAPQTGRPVIRPTVPPPPSDKVKPVDPEAIAGSWGKGGSNG